MLTLLSTAAGCVNQQQWLATPHLSHARQALQKGLEAFQRADYPHALAIFEKLQRSGDPKTARQATYAAACVRLLSAANPREYRDALRQWQAWSRMAPLKFTGEDPRLLTPLLQRQLLTAAGKRASKREKPALWQKRAVPPAKYREQEKEIRKLKARIKAMQEQKPLWEYYVKHTAELENEIWNLKHKINRLEAIDQKIQQKKKEISSP